MEVVKTTKKLNLSKFPEKEQTKKNKNKIKKNKHSKDQSRKIGAPSAWGKGVGMETQLPPQNLKIF